MSSGRRTCGGLRGPPPAVAAGSSSGSSGMPLHAASCCQEVCVLLQIHHEMQVDHSCEGGCLVVDFLPAVGSSASGALAPAGGPGAKKQPQKLTRTAHAPLSRSVSLPPRRQAVLSWVAVCSSCCGLSQAASLTTEHAAHWVTRLFAVFLRCAPLPHNLLLSSCCCAVDLILPQLP